jgi:translation elongation factor EF-Ts
MKNIKTFEDFMNANKSLEENEIQSRKPKAKFSDIVSDKLQSKLWELMHEAMQEAAMYENDDDPEHTVEGYLKEYATAMGSAAAKTLSGPDFFNTMTLVSGSLIGESEAGKLPDYTAKRDELKEYLDACIDSMKEAYCEKLDEVKKTNSAAATLVMKKIKDNRAEIYNKRNKD